MDNVVFRLEKKNMMSVVIYTYQWIEGVRSSCSEEVSVGPCTELNESSRADAVRVSAEGVAW